MNKKKISIITVSSLLAAPVAALSTGIVTSCSQAQDDSGVTVSTKDVEVNHNTGVGEFDIILDEIPADDKLYVYVITAEGPHHMELLSPDERVYHGHPAALYDVNNGIAHVRMGFTEFIGESTKTVVSLEVRYNNRRGDWVLKHIYGINLTVTYIQNPEEEVHLFSLNDLHGVAEGYGDSLDTYPTTNKKDAGVIRIMNQISPIIDDHPGSFLVTAGDNNSGDVFSTSVHGETIYKMLKAMGARCSAVGNHAFEWGLEPMATYQFDNWARTDDTVGTYFISSNILNGKIDPTKKWVTNPNDPEFEKDYAYWLSQKVVWADPYKLVNMNGHLVCLIGLTTKATLSDGNKSVVDNLSFIDYNAAVDYSIYTCKMELIDQVFNSIESFVLLTHVESGINAQTLKPEGDAVELAEKLTEPKIDAVISGHSHQAVDATVMNAIGKRVLVGQAETEGRRYLDITFRFDNTKPVGSKKISVTQKVVDMEMEKKFPTWEAARDDLDYIKGHPSTPTVANVVQEFETQTGTVTRALGDTIATRHDSLLYPGVDWAEDGIGHGYYINEKGFVPEGYTKEDYGDHGDYIIDQLGAWSGYASLLGFANIYNKDIKESSKGLTYPAISFINQDSIKIQYSKPTSGGVPVILKDMYAIQSYENVTKFGYLSIWQLANIINHSLAGEDIFDYNKPKENYYVPIGEGVDNPTPENSLNNLSRYYYVTSGGEGVGDNYRATCNPADFKNQGKVKTIDNTYCFYTCGPVQSYGFAFKVIQADGSTSDTPELKNHRRWVLDTVEAAVPGVKDAPSHYPAIWIMNPLKDPDKPYSTITDPSQWMSAEQYFIECGEYIPVITNDFLFNGANWETPMMKVYMEYNEGIDWRSYPVMTFSTIVRDLMIDFAKQSSASLDFDMPLELVDKLVYYPKEPTPEW